MPAMRATSRAPAAAIRRDPAGNRRRSRRRPGIEATTSGHDVPAREIAERGAVPHQGQRRRRPRRSEQQCPRRRSASSGFAIRDRVRGCTAGATRPQTVITAKSQHSSSHHLPTIRLNGVIASPGSGSGRSLPWARSPSAGRRARGAPAGGPACCRIVCGPSHAPVSDRQLLGDLAFDRGIDRRPRAPASAASTRPRRVRPSRDRPAGRTRSTSQVNPIAAGTRMTSGPGQVAQPGDQSRAEREPPVAGRKRPRRQPEGEERREQPQAIGERVVAELGDAGEQRQDARPR